MVRVDPQSWQSQSPRQRSLFIDNSYAIHDFTLRFTVTPRILTLLAPLVNSDRSTTRNPTVMSFNPRMSRVGPTPNGKTRTKQVEEDNFMTLVRLRQTSGDCDCS